MKKAVFACLISILATSLSAQKFDQCGYDHIIHELNEQHPGFSRQLDSQYMAGIEHIRHQKLGKRETDTIYKIPVVFHIVYNTDAENLPDSLIESQIKILNECFRRKNADTSNTRDIFKPVAADTRIEFYLAKTDPDGNETNGIVRKKTNRSTFYLGQQTLSLDYVKSGVNGGSDPWDTDNYMNIWSCNLAYLGTPSLLGYAYPPVGASGWDPGSFLGKERQGVVLHYAMVGEDNPHDNVGVNSTAHRTAVHEVGHFLGLRHVWGDGFGNSCSRDDFIDDTPNTGGRSSGCNTNRNTCNEGTGDLPDQVENYMDYSRGTCVNMFTRMQADLMMYNLRNLRADLAEEQAPEPEVVIVPSTENKLYPIPVGESVTLELVNIDSVSNYTIEIVNALGQLVHRKNYLLNVDGTLIDMSFLTSGFYYFKVRRDDQILMNRKLVKY